MAVPVIGIVAGEASGDLLGSQLMRALLEQRPDLRFVGIGGPQMEAAGMQSWFPLERLAVRGYLEVLRHLPGIVALRRDLISRMLADPPALFIGIDAPDFNFGVERTLRRSGIPAVHYVSPSLWFWRGERIHKIKRSVDKVLALFPFEPPIYERAGVPVAFVGHPLADMLHAFPKQAEVREQLRLPGQAPVVAMLPGSRQGELEQMADLFVQTAIRVQAALPEARFLVPLVTRETRTIFETAVWRHAPGAPEFSLLFGHAHDALRAADVALVASGTATLEAALLGCPMVITYRVPPAAATAYKLLRTAYLPYFGLPNILAGEFIVPELIQEHATPENLAQALLNLYRDDVVRDRVRERFAAIADSLRQDGARTAAREVLAMLERGRA